MPRGRLRQTLLATLFALYGVTALCGPGLHLLAGSAHASTVLSNSGELPDHPASPHDDCPVCHFLAQAQGQGDSAQAPTLDAVETQPAEARALPSLSPIASPAAPRAPPAS